jgi:hypothetical protein
MCTPTFPRNFNTSIVSELRTDISNCLETVGVTFLGWKCHSVEILHLNHILCIILNFNRQDAMLSAKFMFQYAKYFWQFEGGTAFHCSKWNIMNWRRQYENKQRTYIKIPCTTFRVKNIIHFFETTLVIEQNSYDVRHMCLSSVLIKGTCYFGYWRRMPSSGMLYSVALVRTDVSEERRASIIRTTRIGELGTTLAVTSKRNTLWRNSIVFHFFTARFGC